ncbi:hypothetical protein GCM10027053_51600 [Intrasporangium mesophilum]
MTTEQATDPLPTKDECWDAFWAVIAPAIVDAQQRGVWPEGTARAAA